MARFPASAFFGLLASLLCVVIVFGLAVYRLGWRRSRPGAAQAKVRASIDSAGDAGRKGGRAGRHLEVRAARGEGVLQVLERSVGARGGTDRQSAEGWRLVAESREAVRLEGRDIYLFRPRAPIGPGRYLVVLWQPGEIEAGRKAGPDPLESSRHRWIEVGESSPEPVRVILR